MYLLQICIYVYSINVFKMCPSLPLRLDNLILSFGPSLFTLPVFACRIFQPPTMLANYNANQILVSLTLSAFADKELGIAVICLLSVTGSHTRVFGRDEWK